MPKQRHFGREMCLDIHYIKIVVTSELHAFLALKSVGMFSILFPIHLLKCWKGQFFFQHSRSSLVDDHIIYSCDLIGWFRGDIARQYQVLVTFRYQRFKPFLVYVHDDLHSFCTCYGSNNVTYMIFTYSQSLIGFLVIKRKNKLLEKFLRSWRS